MSDFFDDAEAFRAHQYTLKLHRRGPVVVVESRATRWLYATLAAIIFVVLVSR